MKLQSHVQHARAQTDRRSPGDALSERLNFVDSRPPLRLRHKKKVGRDAAHIENNGAVGVFDEGFLCRRPDDLGMQSGHAPLVRRDDPAFYGIALNEMREGERSEGDRNNEIGMMPAREALGSQEVDQAEGANVEHGSNLGRHFDQSSIASTNSSGETGVWLALSKTCKATSCFDKGRAHMQNI